MCCYSGLRVGGMIDLNDGRLDYVLILRFEVRKLDRFE
jgi:hypothetical protein